MNKEQQKQVLKQGGVLLVGRNNQGEVVINFPRLDTDSAGMSYIVFSPQQARDLAALLIKHAAEVAG